MRKHIQAIMVSLLFCGPALTVSAQEGHRFIETQANVTTVSFLPRSSTISPVQKKQLREQMKPQFANEKVKLKIYAWGDQASDKPGVKAGDRDNGGQGELAENRAATIRDTLQGLGAQSLEVFNLVKDPSTAATAASGPAADKGVSPISAGPHYSKVIIVLEKTSNAG